MEIQEREYVYIQSYKHDGLSLIHILTVCKARYAYGEILYFRQYDSAGCGGQGH